MMVMDDDDDDDNDEDGDDDDNCDDDDDDDDDDDVGRWCPNPPHLRLRGLGVGCLDSQGGGADGAHRQVQGDGRRRLN